jgi:hypothetical protein
MQALRRALLDSIMDRDDEEAEDAAVATETAAKVECWTASTHFIHAVSRCPSPSISGSVFVD